MLGGVDQIGMVVIWENDKSGNGQVEARMSAPQPAGNGAAKAGGILLTPDVGDQLLTALEKQIATVESGLERARNMARPAPFGENVVGHAMADKFQQRADGGPGSLTDSLKSYRTALEEARDSVREAMDRYAESERERAAELGRLGG